VIKVQNEQNVCMGQASLLTRRKRPKCDHRIYNYLQLFGLCNYIFVIYDYCDIVLTSVKSSSTNLQLVCD
jgi:hypothetical protein